MRIFNKTKNTLIAQKVSVADTFFSRLIGLCNRTSLFKEEALLIPRCKAIHMFFMRFSIDVIFLDQKNHVVGMMKAIRPFQFSPIIWKACCALEVCQGTIARTNTALGDQIEIEK